MATQLVGSSFSEGVRAPHFINGRLLTAEDLKAEQEATLRRLASVGQAPGHGVVEGLLVTQAGVSSVQLTPGLGFNRLGQPVRLNSLLTLSLAPQSDAGQP